MRPCGCSERRFRSLSCGYRVFCRLSRSFCAGNPSRADKPATPATRTEIIANGKFLFVMLCPLALETEQGKAIRAKYPESGLYKNDGSKEPFWTVDWYREKVTVASDGVHM